MRGRAGIVADLLLATAAVISIAFTVSDRISHRHPPVSKGPSIGVTLGDIGIEWGAAQANLVLLLNQNCQYCSKSVPFYTKLIPELAKQRSIGLVAVFPHAAADGRRYLQGLGLDVPVARGPIHFPWGVNANDLSVRWDRKGCPALARSARPEE